MVKELVVYPDERINIACTDVRKFDEKLNQLLQDIKDSINEYKLEALSAIQIGYPYNVFVIKTQDGYDEYINPRIISTSGNIEIPENSSYYPNITVNIPRYESFKIVYEDKNAKSHHKDINDTKYGAIFQQMYDHLFGGTFLDKVSKKQREEILDKLKNNSDFQISNDVCPTFSKKDYFVSFTDKLLIVMFGVIIATFFGYKTSINNFIYPTIILLMIGFFFYAQYEAKKYRQCSSCQIGNNIGVIVKRVSLATLLFAVSFFI